MSPEELAGIRANLRPNVPDTHPITRLLAHIDAQEQNIAGLQTAIRIRDTRCGALKGQIEALKEKLVEERAGWLLAMRSGDQPPAVIPSEMEISEARKQLAEDPDLKAAGVTFGDM